MFTVSALSLTYTFCFVFLEPEIAADIKFLTGQDREANKHSSALLLVKLKEEHRCTQAAINTIVEGYRALYTTMIQHL